MKNLIKLFLASMLLISLAACTKETISVLIGSAEGYNGDVTVEVSIEGTTISKIEVIEHNETEGFGTKAIDALPNMIVENQSFTIDVVAGATATSNAIIEATKNALLNDGIDITIFETSSNTQTEKDVITKEADIVVVGGGLSGLSAAIRAAEGGANVILVEKLSFLGGSSAMSGGAIGGVNTSVQEEYGIEDSVDSWIELWEVRQATSPEQSEYPTWDMVHTLVEGSADTIEWFKSIGYEFRKPENFMVDPVLRLHPPVEGTGPQLMEFLVNKADELGIEVLLNTEALELISDNRKVTGVYAESATSYITLNADSTILATGGFSQSEELNERFTPEVAEYVDYSVASVGNEGDGIIMAEAVGAVPYEDPWHIGLGLKTNVDGLGGFFWYGNFMLINHEGNRYTNESNHYSIVFNDTVYKSENGAYMVFDSGEAFQAYVAAAELQLENEELFKAETVEELANLIGVDYENLQKTFDSYGKGNDEFGKLDTLTSEINTAPYYAVKFYPSSMGTIGGVKVDDNQNVLNSEGEIIEGLFAVGEMANRPYYSQVYMTGSALQIAATTGLRAADASLALIEK